MGNFIRDNRRPLENWTKEEWGKAMYNYYVGKAPEENVDKVIKLFNIDKEILHIIPDMDWETKKALGYRKKDVVPRLYVRFFKKGSIDILKTIIDNNLADPNLVPVGDDIVNLDTADFVDFVLEHKDDITVLYDVWPENMGCVRIDGIALKKDASAELIEDLEKFRKKVSKENAANKGRKYQTPEWIVCRWDRGAFSSREKSFIWEE